MEAHERWRRRYFHIGLALVVGITAGCNRGNETPATSRNEGQPPAGDTTPAPRPEPAPFLLVIRPVAGDVLVEGETYTIRWRAAGVDSVHVGLALGGKDKGHAALAVPAAQESLQWAIPEGFVSGLGLPRSDDVRVRIEDAADFRNFAESPSFTVTGAE